MLVIWMECTKIYLVGVSSHYHLVIILFSHKYIVLNKIIMVIDDCQYSIVIQLLVHCTTWDVSFSIHLILESGKHTIFEQNCPGGIVSPMLVWIVIFLIIFCYVKFYRWFKTVRTKYFKCIIASFANMTYLFLMIVWSMSRCSVFPCPFYVSISVYLYKPILLPGYIHPSYWPYVHALSNRQTLIRIAQSAVVLDCCAKDKHESDIDGFHDFNVTIKRAEL